MSGSGELNEPQSSESEIEHQTAEDSASEAEQGHQPRKMQSAPMSETITFRNGSIVRRPERWASIVKSGLT
jgi:hypothetical protein